MQNTLSNLILISSFIVITGFTSQSIGQVISSKSGDGENVTIKKGEANLVYTTLKLTAGELKVSAQTNELLEARFRYPDIKYKPVVDYMENEGVGNLDILLSKTNIDFDDDDQITWDVKLNKNIPMDLTIKLGAGRGYYDLGDLTLNDLFVSAGAGEYDLDLRNSTVQRMKFKAGAGEATIDLSGTRDKNLDAEFTCGFGRIKVILPKDIGVRVTASGLIGTINYPGFKKKDNEYTNELFRKTEITLDIKISGGMGEIDLVML